MEKQLSFFETITGFYNHKDKKFLANAKNILSPYILNQWLANDINMIELLACLDKYTGINKEIYLAFIYYLIPKTDRKVYLKYLKSEKIIDDETEKMFISKLEISKKEFRKYFKHKLEEKK